MTTAPPLPAALELLDVPPSDLWETIRRSSRLISPKVGLLRRVVEARHQAQDPLIFAAGVLPADLARYSREGQGLKAGGAGEAPAVALVAAICEAAERYCSYFFERDEMVLGSYRELAADAAYATVHAGALPAPGGSMPGSANAPSAPSAPNAPNAPNAASSPNAATAAVAPDRLRLFSRAQIEGFGARGPAYFDDGARIRWVWAHSLTEGRPRLVPAALVYLSYRATEDEARIGLNASTGLAAGATREEAILGALLEIVERDAFTLAWLHRQAGRRVEVDDEELGETLRIRLWSDRPSVDVKAFDITTDIPIPVMFLVMRRSAEFGPVAAVGTAARLSPRQALRKSMCEAGQGFPYFRYLLDSEKNWQPAADFSNLTNFDYHCLHYLKRPDLVPAAFAFCDDCADRVALSQLADRSTGRVLADIEYCVAALAAAGYEVIVADITTPDVAECGVSVVRVIVPGLLPLHGDHTRPYLGVSRLYEAPHRLGWEQRGWNPEAGLNPFPHPFP